jgi:predicted HAD superfamily Cof-like phosphohydrolase
MSDYVEQFVEKFSMRLDKDDPTAKQRFIDNAEIFIREEFEELIAAIKVWDEEEIVDALGDLHWLCEKGMIIAGVDYKKVREEIGRANISKELGVKPGREKALKDVIKPEGWTPPNHSDNHGILNDI